jgi:REP element-mobilizing transposase RayT
MPRRRRPQQLELPLKSTWGGKRRNAGRKPGPHPKTPHRARPRHYFGHPVHVTLRARLGSLRSQFLYPTVRLAISRATRHAPDRFRIVHYSVQSNHVHLICEAAERRALTAGVHGLETRITRYVNQLLYRVVAPSGPTAGTAARSSPRVKCAKGVQGSDTRTEQQDGENEKKERQRRAEISVSMCDEIRMQGNVHGAEVNM